MLAFACKRISLAILVAITVSVIVFGLLYVSGDPARSLAGENATPEVIERLEREYGFDRPLTEQYMSWLLRAARGDLGQSIYFNIDVSTMIAERFPITMLLGSLALLFAILVSVPLGVIAALRPNTLVDKFCLLIALFGQALPNFWFAILLIMLFGLNLGWLPISGNSSLAHFILPAIALGYYATPAFMRLIRAEMMDVLDADFIRTARAKGLSEGKVLFKHALRNAIIPVVSLAAVQLGFMLGGSVIIEQVFAIKGLGALAWESISRSDFPVVQALLLVISLLYVSLTLCADLLNALIDPRLRNQ